MRNSLKFTFLCFFLISCDSSNNYYSLNAILFCPGDEVKITWKKDKHEPYSFKVSTSGVYNSLITNELNDLYTNRLKSGYSFSINANTTISLIDENNKVKRTDNLKVVDLKGEYSITFPYECNPDGSGDYKTKSLTTEWSNSAQIKQIKNLSSKAVKVQIDGFPYSILPLETINARPNTFVSSGYKVSTVLKANEGCPFEKPVDNDTIVNNPPGGGSSNIKILPPPVSLTFYYECL